MTRPIQVVVAYDFSPSAEEALLRAVDVAARAPQHVLHIVFALDPPLYTRHITASDAAQVQTDVQARMVAVLAGREAAAEIQYFIHARIGHPAEEILAVAEDVGADLLFIGSHGKTGVERFLMGSVSERVVREARCPVMVVRQKGYRDVDLLKVFEYPHERHAYVEPHRYAYVDKRVITRPRDFPLF